jgi:hypothetical protein
MTKRLNLERSIFEASPKTSGASLKPNCDTTFVAGISSWPWLLGSSGLRIVLRLKLLLLTSAALSPSSSSRVVLPRRLDRLSGGAAFCGLGYSHSARYLARGPCADYGPSSQIDPHPRRRRRGAPDHAPASRPDPSEPSRSVFFTEPRNQARLTPVKSRMWPARLPCVASPPGPAR